MNILIDWIREMTEVPEDPNYLADRLTDIGLEVEEVIRPAEQVDGLVAARVAEARRMKDKPQLTVCELEADGRTGTIVTAAPQVRPNAMYVWAPPGSRLPQGSIETEEIGGEPSEGMLCSSRELGLTREAHTLLRLADSVEPGADVVPVLDLDEAILSVDLTPNRPDCLSHLGVARDFAAAEGQDLRDPRPAELRTPDVEGTVDVSIEDPEGCPAYYGLELADLPGSLETPWTVQTRLLRMGLRPLNPIVDLTNYVMFEVGHPLHPFDRDRLEGNLHVRTAGDDETFVGLDEEEYELRDSDLVIADESAPRALAGIMGGKRTGMSPSSQAVFLEAACFHPVRIRNTAGRLNLHTEASHRFERGVDPNGMERALARVLDLLDDEINTEEIEVHRPVKERALEVETPSVQFVPDDIESTLGFSPDSDRARDQLEALGIGIDATNGEWTLQIPSWRHDLKRPADVIEEIVRLQGYQEVPVHHPVLSLDRTPVLGSERVRRLTSMLEAWGCQEAITFSFVSEDQHRFVESPPAHRLENPLSERQSTLRQSLLDGLVEVVETNQAVPDRTLRFYEVGRVFSEDGGEPTHLAWVMSRGRTRQRWDDASTSVDFYDLKGQCEALLERAGCEEYTFEAADRPGMVEGETARVMVRGRELGTLGRVEPEDSEDPERYAAELNLDRLPSDEEISYEPYSRQPPVNRDLDLIMETDQPVGPVVDILQTGSRVESVEVFDLYRGEPLARDEKSVSVNLRFRHPERTLSDDEVNEIQDELLNILRDEHGVRLREE